MSGLNDIEREQICSTASECLRHGVGRLANFPGLLKRIISIRAWERRQIRTGEVVELRSLSELITRPPLEGWGEDPSKVEAVIKDDPEALVLFREAMKPSVGRKPAESVDNVNALPTPKGNSKSYTVSRLKRQSPELFQQVVAGELSANAAAVKAGIRKNRQVYVPKDAAALVDKLRELFGDEFIEQLREALAV